MDWNVVIYVIIGVVAVVGLTLSFRRMRRGGPGPQVNWIPRAMRGRVNESYRKHGWDEPYDADGNRKDGRADF
jgi:hypothetical protein